MDFDTHGSQREAEWPGQPAELLNVDAWKGRKHSTWIGKCGGAGCRCLGVLCGGAIKRSLSSAEAAPTTG